MISRRSSVKNCFLRIWLVELVIIVCFVMVWLVKFLFSVNIMVLLCLGILWCLVKLWL